MKIYISGKISDLTEKQYIKNFEESEYEIWENYQFKVYSKSINPLNLKPFLGIKCWLCYMITDIAALRKCTHIAIQKNWEDSKGAFIEHFIAKFILKLKVIKLKHDCL